MTISCSGLVNALAMGKWALEVLSQQKYNLILLAPEQGLSHHSSAVD